MAAETILIIKHGALGDWILATGVYKAIRRHHPKAYLIFLTSTPFVDLAKQTKWFNEIWVDDRKSFFSIATLRVLFRIRQKKFLIVYDIQCSERTAWYRRFSKKTTEHWYHRTADSEENYQNLPAPHILERMSRRLVAAGISDFPVPDVAWLRADISQLKFPKPYILIIPGCSPKHLDKRWTIDGYINFIKTMFEKGFVSILVGGPADKAIIDNIFEHTGAFQSVNLMKDSVSLAVLSELSHSAIGAIGSDTGPMHIVGLSCPSLVLFSSASNPARSRPWGAKVAVLQVENLKELEANVVVDRFSQLVGF